MADLRWRAWLRAVHRDVGYLAVGLTIVYALSGLAVNHIADWDPNFTSYTKTTQLPLPLPSDEQAVAGVATRALGIVEPPRDVYRAAPTRIDVSFDRRTLHIDTQSGQLVDDGQKPRFFLRAANWLHLNRGKKAWRWFADGYAIFLLYLALSGIFMLPGKRGIRGRGAVLVAIGVALPLVYLSLAGRL